jgi:hypothetical protein
MELVSIHEGPVQFFRKKAPNRRLASAGHTHQENNHARKRL